MTTLRTENWVRTRQDSVSSHRISRLDKTLSKFSVADSLDLSPNSVHTADTDKTRLGGVGGVN